MLTIQKGYIQSKSEVHQISKWQLRNLLWHSREEL